MYRGIALIKTEVLQFEDAYGNKYDDSGWHQHVRDVLEGKRETVQTG